MAKEKDKIPGGLADGKSSKDFDSKKLAQGIRIEMEHTNSKSVAREIAMDHLTEDENYYDKLKEIEKYDRVDEEADGKKELDYGKEELDKKWSRLKKAVVDSNEAIMEIAGQEYNPDEDEDEQETDQDADVDGQVEPGEGSGGDDGEPEVDPQELAAEQQDESDVPTDDGADSGEQGGDQGQDEQEVIQALQQAGYSEAEIAHIVHGHNLPTPNIDDTKMEGESAKIQQKHEHEGRMNDLEYETAQQEQGINGLDKDHKQRMLDLEYESAKKEKELELEFKKKELEQKLKHKEESQAAKKVDAAKSRSQDAAKTSQKEKAGK